MKTALSTTALVVALASATPAGAQNTTTDTTTDTTGAIGTNRDANADRRIDREEFRPFVDDTYEAWDTNADDLLDEDEIHAGIHGYWDRDRNTIVTPEEYERGYASWFADLEPRDEAFGVGEGMDEKTFVSGAGEFDPFPEWSIGEDGLDRAGFSERLYRTFGGDETGIDATRFEDATGRGTAGEDTSG